MADTVSAVNKFTQMRTEIEQIPGICQFIVSQQLEDIALYAAEIYEAVQKGEITRAVLASRGSSQAALGGMYLLEYLGIAVTCLDYTNTSFSPVEPLPYGRALGMLVSQSGTSQDSLLAATAFASDAAKVLVLTNGAKNPLAAYAKKHIEIAADAWKWLDIAAGEEITVAATKTVLGTTTLVAAFVGNMLLNSPSHQRRGAAILEDLANIGEILETVINAQANQKLINSLARVIPRTRAIAVVSRGEGHQIYSPEAVMKLGEMFGATVKAVDAGDIHHGFLPAIKGNPGYPVFCFVPDYKMRNDDKIKINVLKAAAAAKQMGGTIVLFGSKKALSGVSAIADSDHCIVLPDTASVTVGALSAIAATYTLAERVALRLKLEPGYPVGMPSKEQNTL